MATRRPTDPKRLAISKVTQSVFGSGVVGSTLSQAFAKKFGGEEKEETRVTDAIQEQKAEQSNVNTTLYRIEAIVLNIADNIYNIAGVWSKHVASMEEARRAQAERMSRETAAQEEAASEAQRVGGPSVSGETVEADKKGGGLSGLVASSKSRLGSLLKRFAVMAGLSFGVGLAGAGAVLAGAAAADFGSVDDEEDGGGEEGATSEPPPPTPVSSPTPSQPPAAPGYDYGEQATAMQGTPAQTAPTPVAGPSVAATSAEKIPNDIQAYFDDPANAEDKTRLENITQKISNIQVNIEAAKRERTQAKTGVQKAAVGQRIEALNTQLFAAEQEKQGLFNQARKTVSQKAAAPAAAKEETRAQRFARLGVAFDSTNTGGGRGTINPPMALSTPEPSTGSDVGSMSVNVASGYETQRQPQDIVATNNTNLADKQGQPMPMLSPVANRGSLENGVYFRAAA